MMGSAISPFLEFRSMKFVKGVPGDVCNLQNPFYGGEVVRRSRIPQWWFLSAKDLHFECLLKVTVQMTFLLPGF